MKYLDCTRTSPAENLALDDALLEWCEDRNAQPILRFWEATDYFVVVGYAERVALEVNRAACLKLQIPILRRCSGGGTVLQGPGCLNYALVLPISSAPAFHNVTETNCFIMKRHAQALSTISGRAIQVQGYTDLTCDNLKFSGNSQRRKRQCLLFHGTFLLHFDLARIEGVLNQPSRPPDYRQMRSHRDFLTCLPLDQEAVKSALRAAWECSQPLENPPWHIVERLVKEKYEREEWNFRHL